MSVAEAYKKINSEIQELGGRQAPALIAITKYASDEQVLEAYGLGIRDFGENYVLAALERIIRLGSQMPEAKWHLIGRLQKNKVNKVVGNFELIQSIDSVELAILVARRAQTLNLDQKILLQVNVSGEITKSGFSPEGIRESFQDLIKLKGLKIEGLMTMAPQLRDSQELELIFAQLRDLRDELKREHNLPLKQLSMGMSNDYALAIPQGSTMIRLGRALFKD